MTEAVMLTFARCRALPAGFSRTFQLDRAREEDVVLQMNMLVQIGFERRERLIERVVTEAAVGRDVVIPGHQAHLNKHPAGEVVFRHHHPYRVADGFEEWRGDRQPGVDGIFHLRHPGEQHLLFFKHVRGQFVIQALEYFAQAQQLGVVAAVNGTDLFKQPIQTRQFVSGELMVFVHDVSGESRERFLPPVGRRRLRRAGQPGAFERADGFFDRDVGDATGVLKRPVSAAAVINAEFFKDACRIRHGDCQLSDCVCRVDCHKISSIDLSSPSTKLLYIAGHLYQDGPMKEKHLTLKAAERARLEALLAKGTLPAKVFKRATALLELDRGKTMRAVAQTLGVSYPTALAWRNKYREQGLTCLDD